MSTAVYMRVSTTAQDTDSQRHVIKQWLAGKSLTAVVWYEDVASGKRDDRPQFKAMCAAVKEGKHQTVVVFRLDRLSRKASTALSLILEWLTAGINFYAVDQPILQLGAENPIRLTICSLFAELAQIERETIVSRVKAGLAARKAAGKSLGRVSKISVSQDDHIKRLHAAHCSTREIAAKLGIPQSTIVRRLKRVKHAPESDASRSV